MAAALPPARQALRQRGRAEGCLPSASGPLLSLLAVAALAARVTPPSLAGRVLLRVAHPLPILRAGQSPPAPPAYAPPPLGKSHCFTRFDHARSGLIDGQPMTTCPSARSRHRLTSCHLMHRNRPVPLQNLRSGPATHRLHHHYPQHQHQHHGGQPCPRTPRISPRQSPTAQPPVHHHATASTW